MISRAGQDHEDLVKRLTYIEYVHDDATGLYRRRPTLETSTAYAVVFASEAHAALLREALPKPFVCVTNRAQFLVECQKLGAVALVDCDLLYQVEGQLANANIPVVGIVDTAANSTLSHVIQLLDGYPWLSHFVSTAALSRPLARTLLAKALARLALDDEPSFIGAAGIGRVALLARASRREERFERIRAFFERQGLSSRLISTISDVMEELATNALYDAPMEAGYFSSAVSRTEDVDLPRERACEISYGVDDGTVYIRVRDTFGALTRSRLLNVLTRCSSRAAALDETRGGAGLGLWRVFSAASTLSITVVPNQLTEIVVGIATQKAVGKQLLALDLFFAAGAQDTRSQQVPDDDRDLLDNSVTLVRVA